MGDQRNGRPRDNQRQNKQVRDAANAVGLTSEKRRLFGREVEMESRRFGADLSFDDLLELAALIRGERGDDAAG